ncbi:MAG TPA: hypothetical protein VKM55_04915 [Candidatus Lokiarchaeia archaeon]|nr:hypothetical protein [Candidatus Lokiarchaeia archaeon]
MNPHQEYWNELDATLDEYSEQLQAKINRHAELQQECIALKLELALVDLEQAVLVEIRHDAGAVE